MGYRNFTFQFFNVEAFFANPVNMRCERKIYQLLLFGYSSLKSETK